MLSSIYSGSNAASTAQHSAISPAQSSKPSTCRSKRGSASKQTELARASMSSSISQQYIFEEPSFFHFFVEFWWGFFIPVQQQQHVWERPRAPHGTSQYSTAQSRRHKAANQARADQSATTQASKQSWGGPACRRAFMQLGSFLKTNVLNRNLRGLQKYAYTSAHEAA